MSLFLVGIDGSVGGQRALDAAAALAKQSNAKLVLVYVIDWSPFSFSTPEENAERHRRREEELDIAQTRILDPLVAPLEEQGLSIETVARHGHSARTLINLAEKHQADMIVIGRSGDKPMKTRFFGGTASALTQSASCPVLVVP